LTRNTADLLQPSTDIVAARDLLEIKEKKSQTAEKCTSIQQLLMTRHNKV
jgi:hypothetical protein